MSLRCWYAGEEARERIKWTRGGMKGLDVSYAVCSNASQQRQVGGDVLEPVSMTQSYASGAACCSLSGGGYAFLWTTS